MEERQNKRKYLNQAKHLYLLKFTSELYLRLNHNGSANRWTLVTKSKE